MTLHSDHLRNLQSAIMYLLCCYLCIIMESVLLYLQNAEYLRNNANKLPTVDNCDVTVLIYQSPVFLTRYISSLLVPHYTLLINVYY